MPENADILRPIRYRIGNYSFSARPKLRPLASACTFGTGDSLAVNSHQGKPIDFCKDDRLGPSDSRWDSPSRSMLAHDRSTLQDRIKPELTLRGAMRGD